MNTKKLKQLVLDLAIHGKLVPQDPNDEPASELLKRIQADVETRGRASNKSKGKKSAVSSVDLDEVPFEVPSSWCWTQLGNVITVKSGDSLKVRTAVAGNYPIYGGNGINGYCDSFNVNEQTVLIGRVGFYCGSVHKTLMKSWVTDNALIVNYYDVFFVDYLYWLLSWMNLGSTSNSTAQPVVSGKGILPLFIPLPPLAEQHRIVAAIEKWFAVIDQLEKNEADLKKSIEQTKKKVLDLAIRGKLVAQNPEDEPAGELLERIKEEKAKTTKGKKAIADVEIDEVPFELPKGWVWCRLGEVIDLLSGRDLEPSQYNSTQSGLPYITGASNFDNGSLIVNRWTDSPVCISKFGDLLITCKGTVGELAYNTIGDIHIARQIMAISSQFVNVDYIRVLIMALIDELQYQANSLIPGISRDVLLKLVIPLPPLAEQKRIVEKIVGIIQILNLISGF